MKKLNIVLTLSQKVWILWTPAKGHGDLRRSADPILGTTIPNILGCTITWSEVTQSCPILCNPMDCSLTGSSIHGIFQARILEWVAISFSRRSSQPGDWTQVSLIVGSHFTIWATRNSGGMLYGNSASLRETRQIVLFLTTVCESTIKSVKILLD